MRGETKTTWTKNRHEFLSLANAAGAGGVRARGVAFGTACSAFCMLGWVERIPNTIGVKVRITELGTRALQAWDAGQRKDLDLRTGEELRQQVLEDVMDLAEQHQLDERLFTALLQRMPVLDAQRCIRRAVELAGLASPFTLKPLAQEELDEIMDTFQKTRPHMVLAKEPDEGGMVLLDESGRVLEVVEPGAQPKLHQGGVATLNAAGAQILERGGEYWPKDHPLVVEAEAKAPLAGTETRTVTMVVDEQPPETQQGHSEILHAFRRPPSFVPGGIAGDRPAGPAARLSPAVVLDPPAAEDDEDHGLAMCPSCDGRGIAGPLKLDCRTCKGEGSVRRTVRL